ncbi:MAG: glycosyltransferase family 4 protein, partial [Planctomycetota bacterium]|nr:glycosyltransferase family 4 protein [Planctomycetota bacterium]
MSDACRVLFISATGRLGGAERSLLELLEAIPSGCVEPHLACPSDGPLPDLARRAGVKAHEVGLRRYRWTLHPFLLAGQIKALFLSSSRIARLCDSEGIRIVHANTDSAALVAWEVCRTGRLPFVWHCRDARPLGRVGRLLGVRATRVVAISRMVFDHLLAQRVPGEKLRLVLNGINLSRFGISPTGP